MTSVLNKGYPEERHRECPMKTEAEMGRMWPPVQDDLEPPGAQRERKWNLPLEPSEGARPC